MGQFQASLRMPGDSRALKATVLLHEGRLKLAAGHHVIGDWPIESIEISPIPEGVRLAAEGEVILLDLPDRTAFEQEAATFRAKQKRFGRTKASNRAPTPATKSSTAVATKPAKAKAPKAPKVKGQSRLDEYLGRARERFGSKLPAWVFSRIGVAVAFGVLVFCVIFAELVSNLLLIAGVVILLLGGVTMLDSVIANRLLHHKVSPIQVVIAGGTIFVTGLLIGIAA